MKNLKLIGLVVSLAVLMSTSFAKASENSASTYDCEYDYLHTELHGMLNRFKLEIGGEAIRITDVFADNEVATIELPGKAGVYSAIGKARRVFTQGSIYSLDKVLVSSSTLGGPISVKQIFTAGPYTQVNLFSCTPN